MRSTAAIWRRFFEDWDLLLTPATLVPAFEHTRIPTADRRLTIDGREIEFDYMSFYPSVATLAGLPATALPAGKTQTGLPIGLQAIGPLFEDRTTLQFASLLSEVLEGPFKAPPVMFDAEGRGRRRRWQRAEYPTPPVD